MPISGAYLNISSRDPSEEAPPLPPPWNLFRERCSIPRALFFQLSKSPVDKPSSRFPKQSPYGKRCPPPEPFLPNLQGPQYGSLPSRFPSERDMPHLQSPFQPYLKVPRSSAHSSLPQLSPHANPQSLPFINLRAPNKEAPLQVPLTEMLRSQSTPSVNSQSSQ